VYKDHLLWTSEDYRGYKGQSFMSDLIGLGLEVFLQHYDSIKTTRVYNKNW